MPMRKFFWLPLLAVVLSALLAVGGREAVAEPKTQDITINFVAWTNWSATNPRGVYPDGLRMNYSHQYAGGVWALLELDTVIVDRCGCRVKVRDLKKAALNAPNQSHRLDQWKGFRARMTFENVRYANGQAGETVAREIRITSNDCITE